MYQSKTNSMKINLDVEKIGGFGGQNNNGRGQSGGGGNLHEN